MDDEETEEILYRLDERTEHIQRSLDGLEERMDSRLSEQDQKIKDNRHKAERNSARLALGTWSVATVLSAIVAKITGVLPI